MDFETLFDQPGFQFILSMDCEGTNFDKNLTSNVKNLEKLLRLTSEHNIYTLLFLTPCFADMLMEQGLIEKIKKNPNVVLGLHIHPENLPEKIRNKCLFLNDAHIYMTDYDYSQQKAIIVESLKYLDDLGIEPIQGFRGGYFSMDDETAKVLRGFTEIRWESHNPYRNEYKVTQNFIRSIPVTAYDAVTELRLEEYSEVIFDAMILNAKLNQQKLVAISHSYLLDENDFHYVRDGISYSIYEVLEKVIKKIETL